MVKMVEITIHEHLMQCLKCQIQTIHRGHQMDSLKIDEHTQLDAWAETCSVCHTMSLWESKEVAGLIPKE